MAEATTTTAPQPERAFHKQLLVVTAACIAVPLLFAYVTGSIGIPHNDDWAFLRILFHLADTGSLELVRWNEMTLVGHLALAYPVAKVFGHNVAAVNTFVALVSGAGLFMLGAIARRFVAPVYALGIVVIVAIFPGFMGVVATFMTDNTAFAGQMGCILLGLIAFERKGHARDYLMLAAVAVGLYAFTIREFSIVAPVALLGGYAIADRRDGRSIVRAVVALPVVLAIAYLIYRWRNDLPGDSTSVYFDNWTLAMMPYLSQAFFTFALAAAPAAVVALRHKANVAVMWAPTAVVGVAFAVFAILRTGGNPTCCYNSAGSIFLGNLMTERGTLGNQVLFGDRPVLFTVAPWMLLTGAAIVAGCALLALGVKRIAELRFGSLGRDPGTTTLAILGVSTVAAIVVRHGLGGALFDRYVVVPVVVASIFLLRGLPPPRSPADATGAAVATAMLALVGMVVVSSSNSYDAARWRAGEAAVRAGVPARDVDAGFEWVGFHYEGLTAEAVPRRSAETPPGYMTMFPAAGNCGLVASSPQTAEEFELLTTIPYKQSLGTRTAQLWVYRYAPGCEAAGA